jgi:hypothetical protein
MILEDYLITGERGEAGRRCEGARWEMHVLRERGRVNIP